MREVRHLTPADVRRQPWKNGRGVTDELAIWPPGARFERGDFDWRIARAPVNGTGAFSAFPGFDRVLVIAEGAGLRLEHGAAAPRACVGRLEPYRFSGDWPTTAALLEGPVSDFSVLLRRGAARADVRVLRWGGDDAGAPRAALREPLGATHTFLHLLAGAVELRVPEGERSVALAPRESLWIQGADESGAGGSGGGDSGGGDPGGVEIVAAREGSELIVLRIGDR